MTRDSVVQTLVAFHGELQRTPFWKFHIRSRLMVERDFWGEVLVFMNAYPWLFEPPDDKEPPKGLPD